MDKVIRLAIYYLDLPRRRPLIWIPPFLLVLAIGTYMVFNMPRTYRSEATIAVQSQPVANSLVQSTVTGERLQLIERRVLARENLLALDRKFDLLPALRGTVSDSQFAGLIRAQIAINVVSTPDVSDVYANTTVFSISFMGDTPERAAAVATEIVTMVGDEIRRARLSQASETTQFLEREVARLDADVKALDARWDEFVSTNEEMLPSRMTIYEAELQDRQRELTQLDLDSSNLAAETQLAQAELDLRAPLSDAAARGRHDQLVALNNELSSKLTVMSEAHPDIRSLRSRIAALETEMAAAPSSLDPETVDPELGLLMRRVANATERQQEYAARREEIAARLTWLRSTVAAMPAVETEMTALSAERLAAQTGLANMQARLETARIGERLETDQQGDQFQVIEAADIPRYPAGSGRLTMMVLVGILALGAGFGLLFVVDYLDPRIRSSAHLRRALKGGSFVVLPRWAADRRPKTV